MILVILAGYSFLSIFLLYRKAPVSASMTTAASASIWGPRASRRSHWIPQSSNRIPGCTRSLLHCPLLYPPPYRHKFPYILNLPLQGTGTPAQPRKESGLPPACGSAIVFLPHSSFSMFCGSARQKTSGKPHRQFLFLSHHYIIEVLFFQGLILCRQAHIKKTASTIPEAFLHEKIF